MTQRKIIVYIATSADGYIARADGSVDWLNRPRTAGDYGMGEFFKSIDTVLWGRKTYDMAFGFKKKGRGPGYGSKIKNFVFTHTTPAAAYRGFEFVNESVKDFARRLREIPGKDIWMMGGGGIIGSFLDAGELDEFIIHVIPTFIGEGIPLIAQHQLNVQLQLVSTRAYPDGVVKMHYAVERESKPSTAPRRRGRKAPHSNRTVGKGASITNTSQK
jgi:dihydrofolate reductase